ncbi:amidoligase family protein [Clostridium hydrogeniformans]|uniref:amidoligase family protein n=1 Tax=Clostridium hydrogeniformans TaxID=349933 RepID=UPI0004811618|nr:amidoligase family protein [Clostridium hydrogeniformans]
MPKTRTQTLATRSNNGAREDIQETAERINDRLRSFGTVQVQVESRTRGQMENLGVRFLDSPGEAEVSSASGINYTVNYENGTCDCLHYRMRQQRCRHIEATNIALGQAVDENINSNFSIDGSIAERSRMDEIEELNRQNMFAEQEDDNFFYLDNYDEFQRRLNERENIEYEYNNVLNGSNITFGIELEFVGGNANAIAKELYELGICAYDERVRYHAPSVEGKWKLERDGTVSSGYGGGEIVSPILRDTPETWRNIEKICEVAKRHGATIDSRCGAHVHIGMEPLDTARQRWRRFFKVLSGYEECIYRASGGGEGRIRSGHSNYARTFEGRAAFGATTPIRMDTEDDVRNLAASVSRNDRYYGINLTNITSENRPNTVEFRYFNGSLNASQIQANVKLSNGVIMAAEKARTKDVESMSLNVSNNFKRRGKLINEYDSTSSRSDKKIAEFIDIICTRKKDKDALIDVFRRNIWR